MNDHELRAKIKKVREVVRLHRDQKGDDRCWLDDHFVWRLLADTPPEPKALPPLDEMMARCRDFFDLRRATTADQAPTDALLDPDVWDADLGIMTEDELRLELDRIEQAIRAHRDVKDRPLTIEDDRRLYAVLPERVPADFRLPPEDEFLGEARKPTAGCPSFWRSHVKCDCDVHDMHSWGPCPCDRK